MKKTTAIIVTYNRKELLARCLRAVLQQTQTPDAVIVVDNASTDGTFAYLVAEGLMRGDQPETDTLAEVGEDGKRLLYYRMATNRGGAGGFHKGLELAHKMGEFDAFWMMDDDGYPSPACLETQLRYLDEFDYVMPVSINIEAHSKLSWATKRQKGGKTESYAELRDDWGEIMPFVFPFNGSLLSKKIVDEVGYINPDLFIWGDDYEHYYRCLKAGFTPVTVLDAIFYHPANRAPVVPVMCGLFKVPFVESKLRFTCLVRNWAFINKNNGRWLSAAKIFAAYTWLFLVTRGFDLEGYRHYLACTRDGFRGDFSRHLQYLKQ